MSLLDEEDLGVLCRNLKPGPSKLLSKWVQELGAEQRAAAFMKDASTAKIHTLETFCLREVVEWNLLVPFYCAVYQVSGREK